MWSSVKTFVLYIKCNSFLKKFSRHSSIIAGNGIIKQKLWSFCMMHFEASNVMIVEKYLQLKEKNNIMHSKYTYILQIFFHKILSQKQSTNSIRVSCLILYMNNYIKIAYSLWTYEDVPWIWKNLLKKI